MKVKISLKLLHYSAKHSFCLIRARAPFFCKALQEEVFVSKIFFNHIAYSKRKERSIYDITERLLIVSFVDKIICGGKLVEKRIKNNIKYFRISKKVDNQTYSVVVSRKNKKLILLSCFIDEQHKKRDLSQASMPCQA